jgi:CubicO group peptidase (beta-lactamase class C family)
VTKSPAPDFAAAADYSTRHAGRAVLIMIDGAVAFERYDRGWSAERPHPLASGTKSFTGVLAICAVQDGLLSLDEPACNTLTEWKNDPARSKITVRHLLTLSSGLEPGDEVFGNAGVGSTILGPGRGGKKDEARGSREADDKFQAALTHPLSGSPGGQFEYGPSHFYAFGELLQRKLEASKLETKTVMAYMQARLFDPIGMEMGRMGKDKAGNPALPGGARLTAREWAKFGLLVLQHGAWKQPDGTMKHLIPADLLAQCFVPSPRNPAYGLTWWLLTSGNAQRVADGDAEQAPPARETLRQRLRRQALESEAGSPVLDKDGKPLTVFMAAGKGKQRLYVIPSYNMVVVRFAEDTRDGAGFDNAPFLRPLLGLPEPK